MKLTTAKKDYICGICNTSIKIGEDYWSSPYESLCLTCGKKVKTGELRYDRSKRSYIDTMDMKGQPCVKCGNTSNGVWKGKPVCEDHIGIVVQESE